MLWVFSRIAVSETLTKKSRRRRGWGQVGLQSGLYLHSNCRISLNVVPYKRLANLRVVRRSESAGPTGDAGWH